MYTYRRTHAHGLLSHNIHTLSWILIPQVGDHQKPPESDRRHILVLYSVRTRCAPPISYGSTTTNAHEVLRQPSLTCILCTPSVLRTLYAACCEPYAPNSTRSWTNRQRLSLSHSALVNLAVVNRQPASSCCHRLPSIDCEATSFDTVPRRNLGAVPSD